MKEFLTTANFFIKRKYPSAAGKIMLVLILISLTVAYNTPEVDAYNQAFNCYARLSAAGYDDSLIAENMNEVINFLQSDYRAAGSGDKNGLADAYLNGWYRFKQ